MELQNLHELNKSLKRNGNVEGLTLPDFKACYKATLTNMVWYRHKTNIQMKGLVAQIYKLIYLAK